MLLHEIKDFLLFLFSSNILFNFATLNIFMEYFFLSLIIFTIYPRLPSSIIINLHLLVETKEYVKTVRIVDLFPFYAHQIS